MSNRHGERVTDHEVVVAGCGIAGMSAATRAAELGLSVGILEKSPKEKRGGQTRYTSGFRFPSTDTDLSGYGIGIEDRRTEDTRADEAELMEYSEENLSDYSPDDIYQDLMKVTQGKADPDLAQTLVWNIGDTLEWMTELGMEWKKIEIKKQFGGTKIVHRGRMGRETIAQLIDMAEGFGAKTYYETEANELHRGEDGAIAGVTASQGGRPVTFECDAVIIACGGFESSAQQRTKYMGSDYGNAKVRGSRYNTGEAIDMAIDDGASSRGHWGTGHMTLVDPAAKDVEGAAVLGPDGAKVGTKIYGYQFGVLLNHDGERFVDEGMDKRSFTYARFGREIFEQPDNEAFLFFDSQVEDHCFSQGPTDRIQADTIEDVVTRIGIGNPEEAVRTIDAFNEACNPGELDIAIRDGNRTEGITPPKSNWAMPLEEPPFYALPVTGGITFAPFGGIEINTDAQVLDTRGDPIPGLYAAGNCTGGLYVHNYLSSTGLSNAAVYGKLAAEHTVSYLE